MRMWKKTRKRRKKEQMRNKRLIKKYYWLMPRGWDGKPLKDYDYSWIEWGWSHGWDKAFGQMYMDELGAAIKESGQKDFFILQQKEKYGRCENYVSSTTQKVHDIIDKYGFISENICYFCGVEAPMVDTGWILPECFDCFKKRCKNDGYTESEDELRKLYNKYVCEQPDENGEWHMPDSYTVRSWDRNTGEPADTVYDISETVALIRKRQARWKNGEIQRR